MAERWAVATGNWSATGTWNGGTIPASGDDVYSNNFTVTIDQSITALSLKNIAGTTAVQGGSFTSAMTGTIALTTLNVGAFTGTLATVGLLNLTGGAVTLTVTNTITGDTSSTGDEPVALRITGGTHTVNGSFIAAAAGVALAITGGTVALNGNVTGSTVTGAVQSGGALTITGNVQGGTGVNANGITLSGSSTLVVNGNVTATSSGSTAAGIAVSSPAVLTVNGNVTGGGTSGNYGISTAGTVTVTGDITGGTSVEAVRLSGGTFTARGNFTPTSAATAISNNFGAASYVRVSGDIYAASGRIGISGRFMVIAGETLNLHITDDAAFPSSWSGTAVVLTNAGGAVSRFLNVGGVATPIG